MAHSEFETTVTTENNPTTEARPSVLSLVWLFPEAPVQALTAARYIIGRDGDADIQLKSASVSRQHAEIYRTGPVFAIRDLGSRNGTFLNGQRLAHGPLREGQIVRVGGFVGTLLPLDPEKSGSALAFGEIAAGLLGGVQLRSVLEPVRLAATHELPIIIQAETGAGKELIARSIHAWSGRTGPYHAVNCAALPAAMAEGELFGYRKGAFTGSAQAHIGHIRAADGGTLFLDEIPELPLELQAKLLRVLQEREVTPLGDHKAVPVNVQIVCACQKPLKEAVQAGTFRADLLARLSGYICVVPPLRKRKEDIPKLFEAFAQRFSGGRSLAVEPAFMEQLCIYDWPDNVRELELLTKRLVVLHGHKPLLRRSFLPEHFAGPTAMPESGRDRQPELEDRRAYELKRLVAALRTTNGNLTKAVASLGMSRPRAYRLMAGRTVEQLLNERLDRQSRTPTDQGDSDET